MPKSLIILTIVSVGLIITLVYLPKGIVRDENKKVESVTKSANRDKISEVKTSDVHQNILTDQQSGIYKRLKNEFTNSSSNANKIIFADSLAQFFYALNRPDSSAIYYEKIAQLKPEFKNWKKAGDVYYEAFRLALDSEKGNTYGEKTRMFYGLVLKEKPNELNVKSNMAMTYVTTSTPMQGIILLREVIAQDPDNESALMNLGLLAMQSRQYEKATERFKQIISKHPANSEARLYLGISFVESGKNEEAIKEFNFLKLNEKDPVILQSVNQYLQKLNQK